MIELTLLGTVAVHRPDGSPIDSLPRSPKRLALLSWLALQDSFQRRDSLLGLLWPELDQSGARGALRSLLRLLRKDLGEGVLVNRGREEIGIAAEALRCDAVAFEAAVRAGRHREAGELYGGDLLRGFHLPDARPFEGWLGRERRRLREMAVGSARALSLDAEERGDLLEAVRAARRAASLAPWDEDAAVRVIDLLGRAGNAGAARRAYDRLRGYLADELEVAPSATVNAALEDAVAAADAAQRPRPHPATPSTPGIPPAPPPDRPDPPLSPTWRNVLVHGRARFALVPLVLVVGILLGRRAGPEGAERAPPVEEPVAVSPAVVVLPVTVRGDESLAYLADGLVDVLSAKLDVPGVIRPVDARTATGLEGSDGADAGPAIAERLGAGSFVRGELVRTGDRLHLGLEWRDLANEPLADASVHVVPEQLMAGVDSLVRTLLADRWDTPAGRVRRAAAVTTTSLPALRDFVAGEHAYREGRFGQAAESFRAAVGRDSAFALAHLRLAQTFEWLDQPRLARDAFDRAHGVRDRLTPRLRWILQARRALWDRRQLDALNAYDALLARYPWDVEGLYGRGDFLFHEGPGLGRPLTGARPDFERLLEVDPTHGEALLHLARIAAVQGRPAEVRRFASPLTGGDGIVAAEARALVLLTGGPPSTAEIEELLDHPGLRGLNLVTVTLRAVEGTGGLPGSFELAEALLNETLPSTRAGGHVLRALLHAAEGRGGAADDALGRAAEELPQMAWTARTALALDPTSRATDDQLERLLRSMPPFPPELRRAEGQITFLHALYPETGAYLRGLLLAELGRTDEAYAVAREIETASVLASAQAARTVRAWAAFRSGETERAVRIVRDEREPLATRTRLFGLGAFLHGEILREAGRLEEALAWYESTALDLRLDAYYRSLSLLRQGQVLEALDRPGQAAARYLTFLRRWSEADPGRTVVVRQARAGLERVTAGA